MIVSTSYAAQSVTTRPTQSTSSTSSTSQQERKSSEGSITRQESTVTISEQAKTAARIEAGSLESYRVPNWMVELAPKQRLIDGEALDSEMHSFRDMLNKLSSDGSMSASDNQLMREFLDNAPVRKTMQANDVFLKKFKAEISEYSQILKQAYDQAKFEHGIHTREDYIDQVLNAPNDNTALRNSVVEKLLGDPRALDLMDTLGINHPSLA